MAALSWVQLLTDAQAREALSIAFEALNTIRGDQRYHSLAKCTAREAIEAINELRLAPRARP